ncbi:sensor histidine kinase response regulator, GAF and PAS domain-containing [Geotalea daltonii FRC-32]|uniref:histidine kinase n=1 Tax=Geotalea daltonii (strain DSM 22248 / JCM 15807 / FRC-32) TaxID=316067 RepID=B9M5I0_GEODF|nr:ATP-binding protein [Geotalea daltonii]ACM21739.1 sensor histidine kinase response regulator, GAF and PAS domain-containing [Geotalea daltonii FRC-32]
MLRWPGRVKLTPMSIVLIYTLTGVLWAITAINLHTGDLGQYFTFIRFEIANHTFFILVTALMLYFLIHHSLEEILQREESLHRVGRAFKSLSECNKALIHAADEVQLMEQICRTFVEIGGYRLAWVGIAEHDEERTVRPVAQWGDRNGYLKNLKLSWFDNEWGRGPTGTAIRNCSTIVVQHIPSDPTWRLWRDRAMEHGFAASISLPLSGDEGPFAALVILAGEEGAFDNTEVKLLEELAADLSFGIRALRRDAERKKAEKERTLFASVIQQAQEGIILMDDSGLIRYANPAVEAIIGHAPETMTGRNIREIDCEPQMHGFYTAIWDAVSRGDMRITNAIQRGGEPLPYYFDATLWSISDEAGIANTYAALIRDVTHEILLERQLSQAQRMEAIGTLAGGIAHDFNNSLASIITCTELARDDVAEDDPVRELLDVVLKSSYRGRNLVKQILTFSCQVEQERQPVHVERIIHECLKLLRASFPTSITIRHDICSQPGMVMADPTQIHQIIMNLCTNSGHAMHDSGGFLDIRLANVDLDTAAVSGFPDLPSGRYLRLSVQDTGHGMDQATMERIFDPFFTTKTRGEGTGLGLSVVHGIVKNHGGSIMVTSEPGKGASFHIFLPRTDTPETSLAETWQPPPLHGQERILFVDDEEDLLFAGKKMLERLGYQVEACRDGNEALQTFRLQPHCFDLVITDQTMPQMTGTELTRAILQIREDVPVILCTGFGHASKEFATREGQAATGIRELALKPFERAEMAKLIRRVLDQG